MAGKIAKNNNLVGRRQGRPKGSCNKTTSTVKEAIALAGDRLGGVDRLVSWAQEDPKNEAAFWTTIYPKLLPLQLSGDPENPLAITMIERKIAKTDNSNS